MEIGCYSIDLYCDVADDLCPIDNKHRYGEFPHQYTGDTGPECRSKAKRDGWKFTRDGRTICPRCSNKQIKSGRE